MKLISTATIIHGLLLIVIGLITYFIVDPRDSALLFAPGIGLFLLMQSPAMRKGNQTAFFVVITLVLLMIILTGTFFWKYAQPTDVTLEFVSRNTLNRNAALFGLMSISGVFTLAAYVFAYLKRKKQQSEKEINYREGKPTSTDF